MMERNMTRILWLAGLLFAAAAAPATEAPATDAAAPDATSDLPVPEAPAETPTVPAAPATN